MVVYGGIETGGTKFICIAGTDPDHILAEKRIPTTTPDETIQKVFDFFEPYTTPKELSAVGIASFGPLDLNLNSETYGYITTTPKPGWRNMNLRGLIQQGLEVPVTFDTDVNAAAFGEQYWNKDNSHHDPFIYMTVGTGIGVGVIVNGKPLHGLIHTEAGHCIFQHDSDSPPIPRRLPISWRLL